MSFESLTKEQFNALSAEQKTAYLKLLMLDLEAKLAETREQLARSQAILERGPDQT